jgi:hypothetical protein
MAHYNERKKERFMSTTIMGVVTNGVVVPNSPLPEGATVEVIVVAPGKSAPRFGSALEFLESLPPGPRAFKTWEEYERFLKEERDSWDR